MEKEKKISTFTANEKETMEKMDKFEKDMAAIVDMVDRLPDVEDELTLDAEHPMKLREDVAVEHKFRREEMLANAPVVQSGCLVVPKTVE